LRFQIMYICTLNIKIIKMAKQNKYQQIINVTSEILKQNPKGLKYGELFDMIIEKLPDIEKNTIHGTFYVYSDEFPPEIQKLKRGFYKWIDEPTDTTIEIDYKDKEDEFSVINGKITSIRLRNYNQFTDVFIDLTYPKGHKKAGLPLDKICIIGQSGTGKTSLLNLIRYFSSTKETKEQQKIIEIDSEAEITIQYFMNDIKIALHYTAKKISYEIQQNSKNLSTDDIWLQLIEWQSKQKHKLIYFPADQIKHLDSLLQPSSDSITGKLVQDKVLDFSILQPEYIWTQITDDIKEYNKELANKSLELGKEAELGKGEQAIRNFCNCKLKTDKLSRIFVKIP